MEPKASEHTADILRDCHLVFCGDDDWVYSTFPLTLAGWSEIENVVFFSPFKIMFDNSGNWIRTVHNLDPNKKYSFMWYVTTFMNSRTPRHTKQCETGWTKIPFTYTNMEWHSIQKDHCSFCLDAWICIRNFRIYSTMYGKCVVVHCIGSRNVSNRWNDQKIDGIVACAQTK